MALTPPAAAGGLARRALVRFSLWYAAAAVIMMAWSGLVLRSLAVAGIVAAASTLATMLADPGPARRGRP